MKDLDNLDARGRKRVLTWNLDPSETIQSDAHLTDIRNIMARFGQDGEAMLDETALTFADVSEFTDLADALNQAKEAEIEFMKLPPGVRLVFENDVAVWLDTAHDEEKRDALVEAGFIKRVEVAEAGGEGGAPEEARETSGPAGSETPAEGPE